MAKFKLTLQFQWTYKLLNQYTWVAIFCDKIQSKVKQNIYIAGAYQNTDNWHILLKEIDLIKSNSLNLAISLIIYYVCNINLYKKKAYKMLVLMKSGLYTFKIRVSP